MERLLDIAFYAMVATIAIDIIFLINFIKIVLAVFLGVETLSIVVLICGCVAFVLDKYLDALNPLLHIFLEDLQE